MENPRRPFDLFGRYPSTLQLGPQRDTLENPLEQRDLASYSSTPFSFGTGTRKIYFRQQTSDEAVIKQVLMQQQYDLRRLRRAPELLSFVQRQQERGLRPLVVDAGANIGASAIYFAGNLPKAFVIAIEPDFENFTLLCKNVEGLSVEPVHGAISSAAGHAARLFTSMYSRIFSRTSGGSCGALEAAQASDPVIRLLLPQRYSGAQMPNGFLS